MKAYYVFDVNKEQDHIVLPEIDGRADVDKDTMELFISVRPAFEKLSLSPLNGLKPEQLGRVVATRDHDGDVCIIDADLWRQRMRHYH